MTSANQPFPYYNGITYNSAFFTTESGSGLTIAQANAKYLQKTVQDTASALETFSAGIKTDGIDPTTTGGTIQIGHGATNNNVQILNGTYALGTTAGSVNILTGTNDSFSGGNMNLFTTSRGTLTVGGTNNNAITFNKAPTFSTGLTSNTISSSGMLK
jgi:hypothetical protein